VRRTRQEAEQTRESILDAAERQFNQAGVARTSLDKIARAAGVTRGAVYWHFQNKTDLFEAMIQRVRMPLEHRLHRIVEEAETLDDLERLCLQSLTDIQSDPRIARVYSILLLKCEYTEDLAALIARERQSREHILAQVTTFFERMQRSGALLPERDPATLALALHVYMTGLFTEMLRSPDCCRDANCAASLMRYFFAPLQPSRA